MPKVSVIIPVYNVEKYLRECLDSVVNQTLKDIEIICVDDGSTDSSPAILAEYAAKDPRVRVITQPKANAGAARNAGMAVATGEYLGFVDADDWCELTLFEKAVIRAEEAGADVVIWRNDQYDTAKGRLGASYVFQLPETQVREPVSPYEIRNVIFTCFRHAPWCRLVRRSLIASAHLEFQSVARSNDVLFGCLSLATAGRLALIDEVLYHYRIGAGGNLQSGNDFSSLDIVSAWRAVEESLIARGLMDWFRKSYLNAVADGFFYTLSTLSNPESFVRLFRRLKEFFAGGLWTDRAAAELVNVATRTFFGYLTSTDDPMVFLLQVSRYDRKRFSALWWEVSDLRKFRERTESARKEEDSRREEARRIAALPLLSVVVAGGGESDRIGLSPQLPEGAEILTVPDGSRFAQAIRTATGRFVAFLNAGERYRGERIAEILVLSAVTSGAHAAGGAGGLSAWVFDREWLIARGLPSEDDFNPVVFLRAVWDADAVSVVRRRPVVFDAMESFLRAEVADGAEFDWMRTAGRLMFACDRLDLAGELFERWWDVVLSRNLDVTMAGAAVNAIGYPYLEALLTEAARARGVLPALRAWSNRAAGAGVASFGDAGFPRLSVAPVNMVEAAPAVSVVMPVYNCEAYLVRAIESVRKQTSADWELICVDDGSTDRSPGILDYYAANDNRIRVFHKPNSGVSDTRNLGLSKVRGRYVTFLDGDDWYERDLVETIVAEADERELDVCFFDFRCRDYDTLAEKYHFWTFGHLYPNWGTDGRTFSSRELEKWWYYGSLCQMAWRTAFLRERNAAFPKIPLGEDVALMSELFPFVCRAYIVNRPFYNYQRGAPTSAVTRHDAEKGQSFIRKYQALLEIYRRVYLAKTDEPTCGKFLGRILSDVIYDCTVAPVVRNWMVETGIKAFGFDRLSPAYVLRPLQNGQLAKLIVGGPVRIVEVAEPRAPWFVQFLMKGIERRRARTAVKDVYIVVAQLTSTNDEAIDSWSFFTYLKSSGRPAKFVINRRHRRFAEFAEAYPGDVIGLSDAVDLSYDFVRRCRKALGRAKAVAVEWSLHDPAVVDWLSRLEGLQYVFLQHGLTYNPPRKVHLHWWRPFNLINFCSERERDMVMSALGNPSNVDSVVAGLPRWDLLKDEQDPRNRTLLVMLTWRPTFNLRPEVFSSSAYFNGLRALLSPDNIGRLKAAGLAVKLVLHHALRKIDVLDLDFGPDVEIVSPRLVSHWIRHASALLTDFSSVMFDFLYLKKPVVCWIPDRFDSALSPADREKVMVADCFLGKFIGQARSASEAVDRLVAFAANEYALSPGQLKVIEPFFSSGGEFRRRICEAVEKRNHRETEA